MRRFRTKARAVALGVLAALSGACRTATAPALHPATVAGTYVLDAATPGGFTTGSFVLTPLGQATRRVQYARNGGGTAELVAVGSFKLVRPDSIVFALREHDAGDASYVWHVRGVRAGTSFIIRYPDLDDGEVVELYRRQDP